MRDLALIDALDAKAREVFVSDVWRVTREGYDPLRGGPSNSRWCNGLFNVLYTSLERNGAIAEIHAFLAEQPIFPTKLRYDVHKLGMRAEKMLRLIDLSSLSLLGVDVSRYASRDYEKTQAVADAAFFLEFDGLIAPSARWNCLNAMVFVDRPMGNSVTMEARQSEPIDWTQWRLSTRKKPQ